MEAIEQRSPEWFAIRLGKVTGSRVADVLAKTKTGESSSRRNYRIELVCERLTGKKADAYTNHHMERGTLLEPVARSLYEAKTGTFVLEVGFAHHPLITMAGASPDGLTECGNLIEIKCPTAANHVETILNGEPPSKYIPQMQWQMACTGSKWCDFVSYCPDAGDELALFVKRVERDDKYISEMESEVVKFLAEVDEMTEQLRKPKNEQNSDNHI